MAEGVRLEDLEDWAARTPAEQAVLRQLVQVGARLTALIPLVEGSRQRLAAFPETAPRAQRRQREALKAQLRHYGEELQHLTVQAKELYEQVQPLLGPAAQQYVEQVLRRLIQLTETAQQED